VDSANDDLKVIDVSNPTVPVLVTNLGFGASPMDVAVAGNYAFVMDDGDDDLKSIQLSCAVPVSYNPFNGTFENGNVDDADADPTNEIQDISLNGNQLSISDGSTVILPTGADNLGNHTATQTLSLNGNWLSGDADAEGIFVDGNGNVGIGTSSLANPLVIQGAGTNNEWVGLKNNTGTTIWHLNNSNGGLNFAETDVADFRLFLQQGGNVGIGTSTPAEPLVIQGPGENNKWLGLKDDSGKTLWNLNNLNGGLHFVNQGADRLFLAPTGNVGIGTSSPTKGKVEIMGHQSTYIQNYGWLNSNGQTGTAGGTNQYSLYADDRIAALEFNAFSDARIKNVIGQSNSEQDLSTLMGIEITDYSLIDTLAKGAQSYKKVIAQQVAAVYPQAVSTITDVVPDIYQRAQIEDGWIQLATDLKPGERVKIITEKSAEVYEVTEAEADRFKVSTLSTAGLQLPTVFVYGREVDDFHAVDYEAISMLNVSATQELARRSGEQQRIIEEQNHRIVELEQQIAELGQLKALVEQLQLSISNDKLEADISDFVKQQ
jgi:hypothetical protein